MEQPTPDRKLAPATAEDQSRGQALEHRQADSGVVTETDWSHRFPISRVRWRPPRPAVRD